MEISTIRGAVYDKYRTFTKFADALGWNKQRVSKIITGQKVPNVNEVAEMADALGLTVEHVAYFFLPKKSPNGQQNINSKTA